MIAIDTLSSDQDQALTIISTVAAALSALDADAPSSDFPIERFTQITQDARAALSGALDSLASAATPIFGDKCQVRDVWVAIGALTATAAQQGSVAS